MSIRHIKRGKSSDEREQDAAQVEATVRGILADCRARGDTAIRELSARFDHWQPQDFRLSAAQIDDVIATLPPQVITDIQFAQEQVRNFALVQRDSLRDIEVETLPGVILGQRNIPVARVGCYVPGGRYPMVASAHMSVLTAKTAGVGQIVACTPPIRGELPAATIAAIHFGGADAIYILGGVQALAALAYGAPEMGITPVDMLVGPGNAYVAEAKRQLFGQVGIDLLAGPDRGAHHRRRDRRRRNLRDGPARPGRTRPHLSRHPAHQQPRAGRWHRGGDRPPAGSAGRRPI